MQVREEKCKQCGSTHILYHPDMFRYALGAINRYSFTCPQTGRQTAFELDGEFDLMVDHKPSTAIVVTEANRSR